MKIKQRYLALIGNLSLSRILVLFMTFYVVLALSFSQVYKLGNLLEDPTKKLLDNVDYIYFSFITQSAVGYGDIKPVEFGRWIVVLHIMSSVLLFALGTGIVIFRVLTPERNAIGFADYMLFDPYGKRFRLRFVNRLPVDLYMAKIEMRFRHERSDTHEDVLIVRRKVPLDSNTFAVLSSKRPQKIGTLAQKKDNIVGKVGLDMRGSIRLEPPHIEDGSAVIIVIVGQYFAGTAMASKTYTSEFIHCGFHSPVIGSFEDKPDWKNWNCYSLTDSNVCQECVFGGDCPFRGRLKEK